MPDMCLETVAQVQFATIEAVCKWLMDAKNPHVPMIMQGSPMFYLAEALRTDAIRVVEEARK